MVGVARIELATPAMSTQRLRPKRSEIRQSWTAPRRNARRTNRDSANRLPRFYRTTPRPQYGRGARMSSWESAAGASDEWYTPAYIFEALGCTFDLDVAAPRDGPLHVPTSRWLSSGALEREWDGFVWMNPPFGGRGALSPWLTKFFDHGNGIALTPDRTSAPWFREAWRRPSLVLFMPKVRFIRPDGSLGKQPSNGTTLWAIGEQGHAALIRAASNGLGDLGATGFPAPHARAIVPMVVYRGVEMGLKRLKRLGECASRTALPMNGANLRCLRPDGWVSHFARGG